MSLYPLVVGKEVTITETDITVITVDGEAQRETETNVFTYRVEGIEDVTAPDGTFRSFKVVKYDETGTAVGTAWESDAIKGYELKSIDHESGETSELTSYSLAGAPNRWLNLRVVQDGSWAASLKNIDPKDHWAGKDFQIGCSGIVR